MAIGFTSLIALNIFKCIYLNIRYTTESDTHFSTLLLMYTFSAAPPKEIEIGDFRKN